MKLNFKLSSGNALALLKFFSFMANIWKKGQRIFLQFTPGIIIIFPDSSDIIDHLYGRITLYPVAMEEGPINMGFMKEYR